MSSLLILIPIQVQVCKFITYLVSMYNSSLCKIFGDLDVKMLSYLTAVSVLFRASRLPSSGKGRILQVVPT